MNTTTKISRRDMLGKSVALLASLAILPVAMHSKIALAGTASKADFNFQDHPRNGKSCSTCAAFIPDGADSTTGACRIIEGPITANSWCMAYSERK